MARTRPFHEDDLGKLAILKLAKSDEIELRAATGEDPNVALVRSALTSKWTVVIEDDDENIVGVFGLYRAPGMGFPWFLRTDGLEQINIRVAMQTRKFIKKMLEDTPVLMNFVDPRNTGALKWLTWMGFTIRDGDWFLHDRLTPFKLFYMEKHNHV